MKSLENKILEHAKKMEGKRIIDLFPKSEIEYGVDELEGYKILKFQDCVDFITQNKYDFCAKYHITKSNKNKNIMSDFIEQGYFNREKNNSKKPDFEEAELELKVSGLKINRKQTIINCKERTKLKSINYEDLIRYENWNENPDLFKKLSKILFVMYYFETNSKRGFCKTKFGYNIGYENFKIIHTFKFSPSNRLSNIIQEDYSNMRKLALKGKPLSERVLKSKVFGACPGHNYNYNKDNPADSNPKSLTKHPFMKYAEIKAFQFKGRAVTELIADSLGEKIKKDSGSTGLFPSDFPNF